MASPTQTATYTSNIPEELLPYEKTLLDTAAQYTDIAKNPFQQYTGERVAQTSPLLQQAEDTASQLGVAGQIGAGTTLAGAVGTEALKPYSFTDTGIALQYMSPYMQNVVDVQKQQAMRDATIARQQQQAQAVNAGAFGGGRQGIMNAQANAELQRNLQGIQATGLQNAYQLGQQQYNQEQAQRFQGLQQANAAAGTLGNLGQEQYNQSTGIVGLQGQLGQLEQQRAQQNLDTKYQDFLNYQNYPYKQMGFMSDIIRGAPLTTSAQSIYQAPPTATQSLMSLGLGAYGLNSLFGAPTPKASGGAIKGYAGGGVARFDDGGVTQQDVDNWFASNPNATPQQVASAVQNVGGLDANPGLAGMIGQRYSETPQTISDLYHTYLGRDPDAGGLANWQSAFGTGPLTQEQINTFRTAAEPELAVTHYQPPAPTINASSYFAANPDVFEAYKANPFGMSADQFAQAHYNNYGAKENRLTTPTQQATSTSAPTNTGL